MSKLKDPKWWDKAGTRAIKTIAQAGVSFIGTSAIILSDVNWSHCVSTMILSGIVSLLMSLAGLPEYDDDEIEGSAL